MNAVMSDNKGFTLIELMISLILGLLITAAVMQVYLTNAKTSATQKSGSEIQEAGIFGVQQLEGKFRLANLGNPTTAINDTTAGSGIVVSLANINMPVTNTTMLPLLTHTAGDAGFTSISNMTGANSDQLTIQYKNITGQTISDCESANVEPNKIAIERYFLRQSTTTGQGLILVCDAGRVTDAGIDTSFAANSSQAFGNAGQEFITGVDLFKVLLGVQTNVAGNAARMQYLTSRQYLALANPKPPIIAVKVGIIARGNTAIVGSDTRTSFGLLGTTYNLAANSPKLIRTTYESTTLLRNARVVNVDLSADLRGN